MNHGLESLEETVGDAPKKFHDPESIFWVSNNTFLETVTPKIAKFGLTVFKELFFDTQKMLSGS